MAQQLGQFIIKHWELWLALVAILLLIFINELYRQKKRAKEINPFAAVDLINNENALIIDLRDAETFRKAHIIDAIRINSSDFDTPRTDKYKNKTIILVCDKGLQSAQLAAKLQAQGFTQPMVLAGGLSAWQAADLPIVKGK